MFCVVISYFYKEVGYIREKLNRQLAILIPYPLWNYTPKKYYKLYEIQFLEETYKLESPNHSLRTNKCFLKEILISILFKKIILYI